MPRIAISLFVVVGAVVAAAADAPPAKTSGYASPEEAWAAYVKAGEAHDWGALYDCCTPAARDAMTFDCLLGLKFNERWFDLAGSENKDLHDLATKCDGVYAAHGIDWKQIKGEAEKAEKADGGRQDLQDVCLVLVRDKRKFFVDASGVMAAIQQSMEEPPGKASGARPKLQGEEALPADLGKLVHITVRGDWARGQITLPIPESTVFFTGGKQVRFQTHAKFFRRIDGRWYVAAENGEPVDAPLHKIAQSDIPYHKQFSMEAGDALRFELPGGRQVAVWCEGGMKNLFAAEQRTASGLKTSWGEKPFRNVGYKRAPQPDGSTVLGETKSYIKQGSVITKGDNTSTYQLFVDDLEFDIIEDLQGKESLPVTIRVQKRAAAGKG